MTDLTRREADSLLFQEPRRGALDGETLWLSLGQTQPRSRAMGKARPSVPNVEPPGCPPRSPARAPVSCAVMRDARQLVCIGKACIHVAR